MSNHKPIHGGGHRDPIDLSTRCVDIATAKRLAMQPITSGYGPEELHALADAAELVPMEERAIVWNNGTIEVWRNADKIKRWSQKEEVNGSTAIRLKGTQSRKMNNTKNDEHIEGR